MIFIFFISFFYEISLCKQNSPRWDAAFCDVTSGTAVCLCPIKKGMAGLNELRFFYSDRYVRETCHASESIQFIIIDYLITGWSRKKWFSQCSGKVV